jgi:hypothetical protein
MMDEKINYMSGIDLLARVKKDRTEFASLWAGLTEAQVLQRPGPQDDWSVKDLIAHITYWENYMIERIGKIIAGTDSPGNRELDDINAQLFEDNKDRTLDDITSDFDANLQRLESFITGLTDEQINDAGAVDYGGKQLLKFLISDTFGHYGMHQPDLEGYVKQVTDNM